MSCILRAFLCFCVLISSIGTHAQQPAGSLDRNFGKNGYSLSNLRPDYLVMCSESDMVALPDSSLVFAGRQLYQSYFAGHLYLSRYKKNGIRDSSFCNDGLQAFSNEYDSVRKIPRQLFIQPNTNKLILVSDLAGYLFREGQLEIRRMQLNGLYDSTFGVNGRILPIKTVVEPGFALYKVLVESGGRLLLIGNVYKDNGTAQYGLVCYRFTTNGSLDSSYGINGRTSIGAVSPTLSDARLTTTGDTLLYAFEAEGHRYIGKVSPTGAQVPLAGPDGFIQTMGSGGDSRWVLPADSGKVVVVGATNSGIMAVRRFNASGTVDSSFYVRGSTYGLYEYNIYNVDGGQVLIPLPDGGCFIAYPSNSIIKFLRLRKDLKIDSAFGDKGFLTLTPPAMVGSTKAMAKEIKIKAFEPGKLYIQSLLDTTTYTTRYNYTSTGITIDASFCQQGSFARKQEGSRDRVIGTGTLSDGRRLVLGINILPEDSAHYLLRYTAQGKLDTGFGNNGMLIFKRPVNKRWYNFPQAHLLLVTQKDQLILLYQNGKQVFLQRLHADGSVDSSFGTAGTASYDFGYNVANIVKVIEQPDRRLLLMANVDLHPDWDPGHLLVRLMENGTKDNSFQSGTTFLKGEGGGFYFIGNDVLYARNGKIFLLGTSQGVSYLIAALKPNGSLDSSLFFNGYLRGTKYNHSTQAVCLNEYPDGYITFLINMRPYGIDTTGHAELHGYNQNVNDFSTAFEIKINEQYHQGKYWGVRGLASFVQNDKKIMVAAVIVVDYQYKLMFTRLTRDKQPDSSFGINGVVIIDSLKTYEQSTASGDNNFVQFYMQQGAGNNIDVITSILDKADDDVGLFRLLSNDTRADCGTGSANAGSDKNACAGSSVLIGSAASQGLTYSWTASNGPAPAGIAQPTVKPDSTTTYYLVARNTNNCLSRDTIEVKVNRNPGTLTITPNSATTFCAGGNVSLSTSASGNLQWLKDGGEISGATSASYVVTATGLYTVVQTGQAGCVAASAGLQITVHPVPAQPVITQTGTVLQSSATTGNQWYLEGNIITGATNQLYAPLTPGNYTVGITENGCTSLSAAFPVITTGINAPELDKKIIILPNPVKDRMEIKYSGAPAQLKVTVMDISGRHVLGSGMFHTAFSFNMASYNPGIYVVKIVNIKNNQQVHRLVMKE